MELQNTAVLYRGEQRKQIISLLCRHVLRRKGKARTCVVAFGELEADCRRYSAPTKTQVLPRGGRFGRLTGVVSAAAVATPVPRYRSTSVDS